MCFDMLFFLENLVGRRRRGWLVNWVETTSLECIRWLIKIIEGECNHELLLYVKNLGELGSNPFPYIVPIIPCPLPAELVRGEHFTLTNLLKLIQGSSTQAGFA